MADHDIGALRRALVTYRTPTLRRSVTQMATTVLPLLAVYAAMYGALQYSAWLALALAVPAAFFVVRAFIIQHDCGHLSFFRAPWANHVVGTLCSLVTLTPYLAWRRQHAGHHGNWNNLGRRSSGLDIYSSCLTLAEYEALTPGRRRLYRWSRHPAIALFLLPPLVFLLLYRVPFDTPSGWRLERAAVYLTNLALLLVFGGLGLAFGFGTVAIIELPVIAVAAMIGVWLFSIQHRFDGARWFESEEWTPAAASLGGSSFLRLPRVLQWLSGNIGFHHVHHLDPRIPNYRLEECHAALPALRAVEPLSLRRALAGVRLSLWDEAGGRMAAPAR